MNLLFTNFFSHFAANITFVSFFLLMGQFMVFVISILVKSFATKFAGICFETFQGEWPNYPIFA
jgi:hypothetical protein